MSGSESSEDDAGSGEQQGSRERANGSDAGTVGAVMSGSLAATSAAAASGGAAHGGSGANGGGEGASRADAGSAESEASASSGSSGTAAASGSAAASAQAAGMARGASGGGANAPGAGSGTAIGSRETASRDNRGDARSEGRADPSSGGRENGDGSASGGSGGSGEGGAASASGEGSSSTGEAAASGAEDGSGSPGDASAGGSAAASDAANAATEAANSSGGSGSATPQIGGNGPSDGLGGTPSASPGASTPDFESPVCFRPGTLIATPGGPVAVEHLAAGDLVLTADGTTEPVRWIGRQSVDARVGDPLRVLPIRIRAGAIDAGVPVRDLYLSPDHAIAIGGVLIHAGALVDGVAIERQQDAPARLDYLHVELARHCLILAEGLAAETFVDNLEHLPFDNRAERDAIVADEPPVAEMDLPRAKSARQVPQAVRRRLAVRAALFAHAAERAAA